MVDADERQVGAQRCSAVAAPLRVSRRPVCACACARCVAYAAALHSCVRRTRVLLRRIATSRQLCFRAGRMALRASRSAGLFCPCRRAASSRLPSAACHAAARCRLASPRRYSRSVPYRLLQRACVRACAAASARWSTCASPPSRSTRSSAATSTSSAAPTTAAAERTYQRMHARRPPSRPPVRPCSPAARRRGAAARGAADEAARGVRWARGGGRASQPVRRVAGLVGCGHRGRSLRRDTAYTCRSVAGRALRRDMAWSRSESPAGVPRLCAVGRRRRLL
jgi:hypothetical protein